MTAQDFIAILDALGIQYQRVEIAFTRNAGWQASVRVGRALYVGSGTSADAAAEQCASAAKLATAAWA